MHSPSTNDPVDSFTLELLRSGVALSDLAGELIDAMPPDAHPGEDTSEVVLEMISGSITSFLDETDPAEVRRATALISGALDRVMEHLQLALQLREGMDHDAGGSVAALDVSADAFDDLADELLDCGGVLSQVVAGMVENQRTRGDSVDYVSIPDAAHSLLREVLDQVSERHSGQEAATAAALIRDITNVFTNDIFFINPELN